MILKVSLPPSLLPVHPSIFLYQAKHLFNHDVSPAEMSAIRGSDEAGGERKETEAADADADHTSDDCSDDPAQDYGTFRVSF